ncbi:toxin glutamine deamidase domain-containing protein, partial [Streptomyces kasugaensis]|uniref:toxin glutamine deamidase domain-containing protein n=1 Tax=Streptomyces kasugaensis TaxID=1946 RepID=UPI001F5E6825
MNNFPRNPDGSPQRHADPFQPWARFQNDGGPTVPGRSNNCADCTRSFIESWYGNPQVSAVRTYDNDGHGGLDRVSGERDGTANIQNWAGTHFRQSGQNAQDSYSRIADELRRSGHGSASAVLVTWPRNPDGSGGGAHVFNAVNHNGRVIWVDSQTGQISQQPIHTNADGVWHLTLDGNRTPYDPTAAQNQQPTQNHPQNQQPNPQHNQQQPQPQPQQQHPQQQQQQQQNQPHNQPYNQQQPQHHVQQQPQYAQTPHPQQSPQNHQNPYQQSPYHQNPYQQNPYQQQPTPQQHPQPQHSQP